MTTYETYGSEVQEEDCRPTEEGMTLSHGPTRTQSQKGGSYQSPIGTRFELSQLETEGPETQWFPGVCGLLGDLKLIGSEVHPFNDLSKMLPLGHVEENGTLRVRTKK